MAERDWEAAAAARLQRTIDHMVSRMRAAADQIEGEAVRNIAAAAGATSPYATYARAAGQAVHEMHTMVVNTNTSNIIDAAHDADDARQEKKRINPPDVVTAKTVALSTMLDNLDGWIRGARENHDALEHRDEDIGDECWRQYAPEDIRAMINDTAREVGVPEFPAPKVRAEDL